MVDLSEYFHSPYFILGIALIFDFVIGDPEYRYHPIRLIGNLISSSESIFRRISANQKLNGGLFWFFIVGITFLVASIFVSVTWLLELFFVYSCLAVGDLRKKAFEIRDLLTQNNLIEARRKVGMIVGRDTQNLNEQEIVRATIETIAENIVDGIIAPIFFFTVGGAPLMLAYKSINTLDSMVGYKNETYKDFGLFSAKVDDVANFIPARLSFFIVSISGVFIGKNVFSGIKIGFRDGQKNPSPNSGISEAIVAGLLGIQLGGINFYFGKKSVKPIIGDLKQEIKKKHINESIYIAYFSSVICLSLVFIINYLK